MLIKFINISVTPNDILKILNVLKSKNKIQNAYLEYNDENKLMLYFSVKNASEPIIKAQFQIDNQYCDLCYAHSIKENDVLHYAYNFRCVEEDIIFNEQIKRKSKFCLLVTFKNKTRHIKISGKNYHQTQDAIAKIKNSYKAFFTNSLNFQNHQINLTSKDC